MKIVKKVSEFQEYRSAMNDKILNSGFKDFMKFFALDNKAYIEGALPAKMKELMGLVASMVLRCNGYWHNESAPVEGALECQEKVSYCAAVKVH